MPHCEICKFRKTLFFHRLKNFKYYNCPRCKTLFLSPKPGKKEINRYYRKSFTYSAGEANEKMILGRAKIIISQLRRLNPKGKTLLDVGSGYGYFLDEGKKQGLIIQGIEPSSSLYFTSIKRLIEVNVENLSFEDYFKKNEKKKYDFITLIHTIEHLANPRQTIYKTSKLLNPGGILYIETPNLDSQLFYAEKQNYTFLTPPDHIWIFSPESFRNMLKNIPSLKIDHVSTYSYPEHLMGIVKTKIQISKSKSQKKIKVQNPNSHKNLKFENWDWGFDWKPVNQNFRSVQGHESIFDLVHWLGFGTWKFCKYFLFDKLLSPFFTPLLNLGDKGSILELYLRKK